MANEEQLQILGQGVKVWNKWRSENPHTLIDLTDAHVTISALSGANLSQANLDGITLFATNLQDADLHSSTLIDANLSNVSLYHANLEETNLTRAILDNADLEAANFEMSNLTGASLINATLLDTNLNNCKLIRADFTNAVLRNTRLDNCDMGHTRLRNTILGKLDLTSTKELDSVDHHGPSILGADTIYLSKGKIPEKFLRGCGLNDIQIESAKLAVAGLDSEQVTAITYKLHQLYLGSGIQYYSCFISYNSKDEAIASRLYDDLQNHGVRCWFALEDMKIGDQIRPRIDQEIRLRDKLLVILSENSIKSDWVGDEVEGALEEESKSNRLVLFPIRLDDTVLNTRDDWAAKIKRRRHIGDFSNWKDKASYQKAFERLLRDLKATGA